MRVTSNSYELHRISAIAPANAQYIEVTAFKLGAGILKVDEFSLEETEPVIGECILVENEGFEDDLDNWSIGGSVSTSTDANSGSNSAQIIGNGSYIVHRLGIKAGDTYEYTGWAKVTSSAPTYAELYLEWRDASNNVISDIVTAHHFKCNGLPKILIERESTR